MSCNKIDDQNKNEEKRGKKGNITLIIGPMFSGKTTELVRLIKRQVIVEKRCMIICHVNDNRYTKKNSNSVINHDKHEFFDCDVKYVSKLGEINADDYDVIGVDEISFFDDIELINIWANSGIVIIVAGLDGDYKQKNFKKVHKIIPNAEKIIKLTAVCKCGNDASFTIRKNNETNLIVIGGKDIYDAVCRECLNKHTSENNQHNKNDPQNQNDLQNQVNISITN